MTVGDVVALLSATGVGLISKDIVSGLIARYTGRAERERDLLWKMTKAYDQEATHRRKMQEYSSMLIRLLLDNGIPANVIPPYPTMDDDEDDNSSDK